MKYGKMFFIRTISIIVVLVTCLTLLPSAAFAEGIWNTDQSIGDNIDEAINAQVVIEGSNAVAIWVQHVPYDDGYTIYDDIYRVFSNYSSDGGVTWNEPQLIENNAGCPVSGDNPPRIAISGQNVIAVWQQLNPPSGWDSIFSNYSTDGGKTWHTDVEVDNLTTELAYNPYVALDGNHAVAIWHQIWDTPADPISTRVARFAFSFFDFGSPGWSAPVFIEDNPYKQAWDEYDSRIAISGPNVLAVWQQKDAASYVRIYSNFSSDYGASWQGVHQLDINDNQHTYNLNLDMSSAYAIAVWEQSNNIYRDFFDISSAGWSGAELVENSASTATAPDVAISGTNQIIVWVQSIRIYSSCRANTGDPWSVPTILDDGTGSDFGHPRVDLSGLNAVAVWEQYMDSHNRIYANCSIDGGLNWNYDPLIENNDYLDAYMPDAGISGSNAVVVWYQYEAEFLTGIFSNSTNFSNPALVSPQELWVGFTNGPTKDLAVGNLIGDTKEDVAAIDYIRPPTTLNIFNGDDSGPGDWSQLISGYSVAVGDIDGDTQNEVIASWDDDYDNLSIVAYENDGTFKWSYTTQGTVTDIEIGDIDGDSKNDVIASCVYGDPVSAIHAIDGETGLLIDNIGGNSTAFPFNCPNREILDIAVGQLDGIGGVDIAAIGIGGNGALYALDSYGNQLWFKYTEGRAVEIGDIHGDEDNDNYVVVGTEDKYVVFFGNSELTPAYETTAYVIVYDASGYDATNIMVPYTVTDIELGDLDGNPANGKEVAAIDSGAEAADSTLYALDVDNYPNYTMWTYPMSWNTENYGEALAIGDVDRDYKNEVVAASGAFHRVYAFDGLDKNNDGLGDLVWTPYDVTDGEIINDVELGDLDGDGDQDVVFCTEKPANFGIDSMGGGVETERYYYGTVYAISAVDSSKTTFTNTGTAYFDSDPSTLENLVAVAVPAGAPATYTYPHGFFTFEITGLEPGTFDTAIVTVTLPTNAPIGTKWVKNDNDTWTVFDIGDDDGDNVITFILTDTDGDGTIFDPGAPAYPLDQTQRPMGVGGEVSGINKSGLLMPWIALIILMIGGTFLLRSRRKNN